MFVFVRNHIIIVDPFFQMAGLRNGLFDFDYLVVFKVVDWQNCMRSPKYRPHNLVSWLFHFWLFLALFAGCCPVSWLPFCFWVVEFRPLLHIDARSQLYLAETAPDSFKNRQHVVVFVPLFHTLHPIYFTLVAPPICHRKNFSADVMNTKPISYYHYRTH